MTLVMNNHYDCTKPLAFVLHVINWRRRGAPTGKDNLNAGKMIFKIIKYITGSRCRTKMDLAGNVHGVMMHNIAQVTFFLNDLLWNVFGNIKWSRCAWGDVVLMRIYHKLARNKADQQNPGTDNMIFTRFQINKMLFLHLLAKVLNKSFQITV